MKFRDLIDRIDEEARGLDPHKVALSILAAPFFALGIVVGLLVRSAWLVIAWLWVAGQAGYRMARGRDD